MISQKITGLVLLILVVTILLCGSIYMNIDLNNIVSIKSRNNSKSVTAPRQIAMYLCKKLTNSSLPLIGKSFGGKHHSTVIHSIRKVEANRKRDASFNTLIQNFLKSFS